MNRRLILPMLALMLLAGGCAHARIVNGTLVSDDYHFSITLPMPPYEPIAPKETLVALIDPQNGASIAISVSPDRYSDTVDSAKALDFSARSLFFFLTKKQYRTFEDVTLDGAPARHVTLTGFEDDRELIFSAYVVRFSGMVYDIVMWCEPQYFDTASAVFEKMAATLTLRQDTDK